ncbi:MULTISPECIES: SCP2 sterol-binding domain-containing protein [unclassified Mesorhizobium]|uniref:ubiquinone anaerobic biosynthesis accessory factor UbiT n=1 Tax=unclassified Mesorhizobium TaxID=325217 RepID=UPI0011267B8D|nr:MULTISPECIES: SCP2 sterol-binding domain-containing protein [unclassified Mesorhizobium]TPJ40985.1 lipid carrier [Mesorhizobium sp. B2-6-6]MCA0008695.1 SCP2 sterol-binding domain-containing protein [Mesorhizobium sp. B264B1B]MCA0019427.1 SCP2 sterol-binding domain-containing protein [Mesorhizobium sp. B264B1A]MCA0024532.1 SCP2 sterol-binding domain-containing protein [Mesorhizobium sp. B263B1A]MCA0055796.1 SCP2 sterol-binding domain-containing protein [Mesorhizobium sp. B261B1A]
MVTISTEPTLPAVIRHLFPPFAGLPLGPLLTLSLRSMARRQPRLFDRLGEHRTACDFIDPVDLAFAFTVVPDAERSIVRVVRRSEAATSNVQIRGPLLTLLSLLDGTLDGDALFFSRIISISGRTEAVLALRNTIEDAELSPADLLGLRGFLARLANTGILGALSVARQMANRNSRREAPEA